VLVVVGVEAGTGALNGRGVHIYLDECDCDYDGST
jgi:hypothetical protein